MNIVGGIYRETCAMPHWDNIFGSGGRAASAIAKLSPNSVLSGYISSDWKESFIISAATYGFDTCLTEISERIQFDYLHPLSRPKLYPPDVERKKDSQLYEPLRLQGDVVLRFDLLEGDAIVSARRAVYDPQTGGTKKGFFSNGSTADELAVVLNEWELIDATGLDIENAANTLLDHWNAHIIVVKRGARGATVVQRNKPPTTVPSFKTSRVFKIGSGDVFSAVFAHAWGELGHDPVDAATMASIAVSSYVESRMLPLVALTTATDRVPFLGGNERPQVYLAGPFFDISQRWLIEECLGTLEALGLDVFSPLHHVGAAADIGDPQIIATKDLEGLRNSAAILGLVDSKDAGTIFEIGYGRALKEPKPVVILAERFHEHDYTMFSGTGCIICDDLATALYHTVWAAG